jgi:3D (Asp-Asp-Asp) domain-containing protein
MTTISFLLKNTRQEYIMKNIKKYILSITMTFSIILSSTAFFAMPVQAATVSKKVYLGKYTLTAYCNCKKCCGKYANKRTASGTKPKQGRTIAVDKKKIKLGTKINFNGNTYTAEDTGSAIKGNRIDVYFNSHKKALKFGKKKNVKVYKVTKTKSLPAAKPTSTEEITTDNTTL